MNISNACFPKVESSAITEFGMPTGVLLGGLQQLGEHTGAARTTLPTRRLSLRSGGVLPSGPGAQVNSRPLYSGGVGTA